MNKSLVLDKLYFVPEKFILSRTNLILSQTKNILSRQMDRASDSHSEFRIGSCPFLLGRTMLFWHFGSDINRDAPLNKSHYLQCGLKPAWDKQTIYFQDHNNGRTTNISALTKRNTHIFTYIQSQFLECRKNWFLQTFSFGTPENVLSMLTFIDLLFLLHSLKMNLFYVSRWIHEVTNHH